MIMTDKCFWQNCECAAAIFISLNYVKYKEYHHSALKTFYLMGQKYERGSGEDYAIRTIKTHFKLFRLRLKSKSLS